MQIEKLQGTGWLFDAEQRRFKVSYTIVVTQFAHSDVTTRVSMTLPNRDDSLDGNAYFQLQVEDGRLLEILTTINRVSGIVQFKATGPLLSARMI